MTSFSPIIAGFPGLVHGEERPEGTARPQWHPAGLPVPPGCSPGLRPPAVCSLPLAGPLTPHHTSGRESPELSSVHSLSQQGLSHLTTPQAVSHLNSPLYTLFLSKTSHTSPHLRPWVTPTLCTLSSSGKASHTLPHLRPWVTWTCSVLLLVKVLQRLVKCVPRWALDNPRSVSKICSEVNIHDLKLYWFEVLASQSFMASCHASSLLCDLCAFAHLHWAPCLHLTNRMLASVLLSGMHRQTNLWSKAFDSILISKSNLSLIKTVNVCIFWFCRFPPLMYSNCSVYKNCQLSKPSLYLYHRHCTGDPSHGENSAFFFLDFFYFINSITDHVIRIPWIFQNVALNWMVENLTEYAVGNERLKMPTLMSVQSTGGSWQQHINLWYLSLWRFRCAILLVVFDVCVCEVQCCD